MYRLAAWLLLPAALYSSAQQLAQPTTPPPPAGSNWQHVQRLPTGTSIYVYTRGHHQRCELESAAADTLSCIRSKSLTFQRTEIVSIKLAHRGRSSLVGLAVGAGAGIGIGYAIPLSAGNGSPAGQAFQQVFLNPLARGVLVGLGAASGSIGGTLAGYFTDFSRSTVYKAP
jgi:hypothetical protein